MSKKMGRRRFLTSTVAASTVAGLSLEESALLAYAEDKPAPASASGGDMPVGKIGEARISRIICGGNLVSGYAHSRDLIYVSTLLKHYFTDEKIFETFALCEQNGINTAMLKMDPETLRLLNEYWHKHNGNIQWIAQIVPKENELTGKVDVKDQIRQAADNGAIGCFFHGESGDRITHHGNLDALRDILEAMKDHGVVAGMGAHGLEVLTACEQGQLPCDFYMKTFNSKNYWSAEPAERHDSVWEETPDKTIEFMGNVAKPWVAFKVLAAGAIAPEAGFRYAFEHGADFLCVGMFDFQVAEDAALIKKILAPDLKRQRPWRS